MVTASRARQPRLAGSYSLTNLPSFERDFYFESCYLSTRAQLGSRSLGGSLWIGPIYCARYART
jgi:hypothetical protein